MPEEETSTRPSRETIVNAIKAGAWTALFSFVTLFGLSLLSFLQEIVSWSSASGQAPFPEISVLGYAFVTAFVSAITGIVNSVIRLAQAAGVIPGGPPSYPSTTARERVVDAA